MAEPIDPAVSEAAQEQQEWGGICDYYDPAKHEGSMPVRVVGNDALKWFEDISTELRWKMEDEIKARGLQPGIGYAIAHHKIRRMARIHPVFDDDDEVVGHKMELHEPFLQLIWCTGYAMTVLYEEAYSKPGLAGTYTGVFDMTDPFVQKAIVVFKTGLTLRKGFKPHHFYWMPNPEEVFKVDSGHIYRTNGVYCAAVAFILAHELAHKTEKHVDRLVPADMAKQREFEADKRAAAWIKEGMGKNKEQDTTNVFGAMTAMTVMLLIDNELKGSRVHPPTDERLERVIAELDSEPRMEILWLAACLGLRLWIIANPGVDIPATTEHESYKPVFEDIMRDIVKQVKGVAA